MKLDTKNAVNKPKLLFVIDLKNKKYLKKEITPCTV